MMRKVILFIAMSLDGYIADKNDRVDWLKGENTEADTMDFYTTFIQDVDTVIMGWNTYHQIVTELSPEKWVYEDLISYVITHKTLPSTNQIIFTKEAPCHLVQKLRQQPGKHIWICGGANIVQQLIEADLIDEYHISVIPTILGAGIRLFHKISLEIKLKLSHMQVGHGIVDLVYLRREK